MRISSLLAPELEETLRTNPAHAAELAEELHAADLAELIDGLADELAAMMVAALPVPAAAAALDAMDPQRRVRDLRAARSRAGGDASPTRCRPTSAPTCSARCPTTWASTCWRACPRMRRSTSAS